MLCKIDAILITTTATTNSHISTTVQKEDIPKKSNGIELKVSKRGNEKLVNKISSDERPHKQLCFINPR